MYGLARETVLDVLADCGVRIVAVEDDRSCGDYAALWWIPAGHIPSVDEAKERLARLERDGPMPFVFAFQQPFPPEAGSKALAASM